MKRLQIALVALAAVSSVASAVTLADKTVFLEDRYPEVKPTRAEIRSHQEHGCVVCVRGVKSRAAADYYRSLGVERFTDADPVLWTRPKNSIDRALEKIRRLDCATEEKWLSFETAEAADAYRRQLQASMAEAVGGFPERTPLNARTTGVLKRPGYRVEKVLFESEPMHHVTGYLFLPDAPEFKPPYPGVLVPLGHANTGKFYQGYYKAGVVAARAGLAALVYDPIDQGERRQQADGVKCVAGHVNAGLRAELVGWSLARFRIRDAMRALDYLESRPEVDGEKLGVMGQSGGGTVTAYVAALDPRVKVSCPSGFVTTSRDLVDFWGPQDCEQNIPGAMVRGLNHLSLMLMMAPKPVSLMLAEDDAFPSFGSFTTLEKMRGFYSKQGLGDRVGFHLARGKMHGWYDCTREASVRWIRRWLTGVDAPAPHLADEEAPLPSEAERYVVPEGDVTRLPGERSVYDMLRMRLEQLEAEKPALSRETVARFSGIDVEHPQDVREDVDCVRNGYWASSWSPADELACLYGWLGTSLVRVRAERMIAEARRHLKKTGCPMRLVAKGHAAVPAAHAYYLARELFSGLEISDPPPSWRQVVRDPNLRIAPQDIVFGALAAYDWTDLLPKAQTGPLVEAEAFDDRGGWTVDQQFMDQMGSPFLLAHGLGTPVADAVTSVNLEPGKYRLWVRTRDWCRPEVEAGPGAFNVRVNGTDLGAFGVGGSGDWEWTKGPEVTVDRSPAEVRLCDGSGFEGRVDAFFFGRGEERPPETWEERRRLLGLGAPEEKSADLVVVGGGMAGLCAAVTAAREGLSVVLVQDRPVFGGNASSEVRVHVLGKIGLGPFPHNGDVLKEILSFVDRTPREHARDNWRLDDRKLGLWLARQRGLTIVTETRVMSAEKAADGAIAAVVGRHVRTGRETRFTAKMFVDATGDGAVAVAAGADFRTTPETQAETGERLATDGKRRGGDYGSSLYWFTRQTDEARPFPSCPWAISVEKDDEAFLAKESRTLPCGGWNWETGFWEDNVRDGERIRDRLFRAIYGTWDYVKNKAAGHERQATAELYWAGVVLGKRAARRVLGDYILTEQDLENNASFADGVVTTDWYIDLHFPHPRFERRLGKEAFRSTAYDATRSEDKVDPTQFVGGKVKIRPTAIPYRCLYSRNVPNLFLAGKDISATHVAMGSHRVMNTGGAMGTVVGRAAALCKERNCRPRQLSEGAGLAALKERLAKPLPEESNLKGE